MTSLLFSALRHRLVASLKSPPLSSGKGQQNGCVLSKSPPCISSKMPGKLLACALISITLHIYEQFKWLHIKNLITSVYIII